MASPKKDVPEILMGTFGRWHFWICAAIFLVKFPIAWHQLNALIETPPVKFFCIDNKTNACSKECPQVVFDRSVFKETIISQWSLVCERAILSTLAQTISMLGVSIGNLTFGYLADRYGRRLPFVICIVIEVVFGCTSGFIPIFWLFLIFRFMTTMATGGTMVISFVFILEFVGIKWRTTASILYQVPFNLGHLSLALVGYLLRDWRYIQLFTSLPSIILVSYYWILLESPRWLLSIGETEKAIEILEKIARYNKLPAKNTKSEVMAYVQKKQMTAHRGGNICYIFTSAAVRKNWLCLSFIWIVSGMGFFGVTELIHVEGDVFIDITFSAVIQIPGTLISIWLVNLLGRRKTLVLANVITGISCISMAFMPKNSGWVKKIMGSIGCSSLLMAFCTSYVYTGELFPTIIRSVGVGSSLMWGKIGSMVGPFIARLDHIDTFLAPMVFGITPIFIASVCFMLPETKDCFLPDTVEESEAFEKWNEEDEDVNEIAFD